MFSEEPLFHPEVCVLPSTTFVVHSGSALILQVEKPARGATGND